MNITIRTGDHYITCSRYRGIQGQWDTNGSTPNSAGIGGLGYTNPGNGSWVDIVIEEVGRQEETGTKTNLVVR